MKTDKKVNTGFAAVFRLCPVAHCVAIFSALIVALHLMLRSDHALMAALSERMVKPIHRSLSLFNSRFDFSVAELLIGVFVLAVLVYIILRLVRIIHSKNKLSEVYITFISLLAAGLFVYAGFCLLWGVYYYGDDFATANALDASEISTQDLETVTLFFANRLNDYGQLVDRDSSGAYAADRSAILARSDEVFSQAEKQFPALSAPAVKAKGVFFSRVMSYLDFTGFFFPFTAEANVNTDFPPSLFASTVAHELAHQRSVAKEQEANFAAVLACLSYGDVDYCYSACMLAYIHLGNALYSADYDAWEQVYGSLSDEVRLDMSINRAYWAQFETPVQRVSNTVYEGFLHSYDQTLGLKSYGACVDLLVNYYLPEATAAQP